jgi:hypothetical protein
MYVSSESTKPYHVSVFVWLCNAVSGKATYKEKIQGHIVVPVQRQLNGHVSNNGELLRFGAPARTSWGSHLKHVQQDIPRHALRFQITPFMMGDDASDRYVSITIKTPSGSVHLPTISIKQTCGDLKNILTQKLGYHCNQDSELFQCANKLQGSATHLS